MGKALLVDSCNSCKASKNKTLWESTFLNFVSANLLPVILSVQFLNVIVPFRFASCSNLSKSPSSWVLVVVISPKRPSRF